MKLASQIEKVLFATHNQMRTDPKSFVPIMENAIRNFESPTSTLLKRIGRPDLSTEEGVNAWIEAKNAFITQPPLPPLQWSDALSLAAQDHCSDVGGEGRRQP